MKWWLIGCLMMSEGQCVESERLYWFASKKDCLEAGKLLKQHEPKWVATKCDGYKTMPKEDKA